MHVRLVPPAQQNPGEVQLDQISQCLGAPAQFELPPSCLLEIILLYFTNYKILIPTREPACHVPHPVACQHYWLKFADGAAGGFLRVIFCVVSARMTVKFRKNLDGQTDWSPT